jgi:hypothetical protein
VLEGHLLAASLEELVVLWLVGDRAHAALGADDGQVSDSLTLSYFKSSKTSLIVSVRIVPRSTAARSSCSAFSP